MLRKFCFVKSPTRCFFITCTIILVFCVTFLLGIKRYFLGFSYRFDVLEKRWFTDVQLYTVSAHTGTNLSEVLHRISNRRTSINSSSTLTDSLRISTTGARVQTSFELVDSDKSIALLRFRHEMKQKRPLFGPVVIYNRLPKCGSSSMQKIIASTAKRNGFKYMMSDIYHKSILTQLEQKKLIDSIMAEKGPFVYDRHVLFLDVSRFGYNNTQPVYINLVREPLERLVSEYYFLRHQSTKKNEWYTDEERNETFDECVARRHPGCLEVGEKYTSSAITYFCGHDDVCMHSSEESLAIAKRNAIRHYAVVGVTAQFSHFLRALEFVVPEFFRGASEIYRQGKFRNMEGRNKITPTKETGTFMRNYLRYEYDFYDFLVQRFHDLLSWIKKARTIGSIDGANRRS